MAADMTTNLLRGAMVRQRHTAIRALGHIAAGRALQRSGVAASIEKQDGLFPAFKSLRQGFFQLWLKDRGALFLSRGAAHVHNLDERHFFVICAAGHLEQGILSLLRVMKAFK